MSDTEEFNPEEMEDYIIGATISSQSTPLTDDEEEQVARYSMFLAVLSLVGKGMPPDLAIDVVEQASEKGDILINVKEDEETGDYILSVSIGDSE